MEVMMENYLDLTIDEVYDVIMTDVVWPASFDSTKKIAFINHMIIYFEKSEEYEKCASLQWRIHGMEDSK